MEIWPFIISNLQNILKNVQSSKPTNKFLPLQTNGSNLDLCPPNEGYKAKPNKTLKQNKASNEDGIIAELFKAAARSNVKEITKVTSIWETGKCV